MPVEDIIAGARFLVGLPRFFRSTVTTEAARAELRERLHHRADDFLHLTRSAIYDYPESPYLPLLDYAGCQHGDLEQLVRREGVEEALSELYRAGVYLTTAEARGRRPVVRGSTSFTINPRRLRNPAAEARLRHETRGSGTGVSAPAPVSLESLRDYLVDMRLILAARGAEDWQHAFWGVPGSSAIGQLLRYTGAGARVERWFAMVDPTVPALHPRYRWSERGMRWVARLSGVSMPRPEHVAPGDPLPIARWMAGVVRAGGTPSLHTFASSAARLCQVATQHGVDLQGAHFYIGGEPITAGRLKVIRDAGAHAMPHYASAEAGGIGQGCLRPEAPDDVHFMSEKLAVIQPGESGARPDLPARSLLLTSVQPRPRSILLNLSIGDEAEIVHRSCGCSLAALGWDTHLHSIRSFTKLTAGGMTFLDTDLIQVLEQELPARFGGGPLDYQLAELEGSGGGSQLHLRVHPRLGPLATDALCDAFYEAIGPGSGVERVMALAWRDAHALTVLREPPQATAAGKILHLDATRRDAVPG